MKQHLEALRASQTDCHVVAYGDAAAQIVLRASHDKAYRREHLDQLCAQAATCFEMLGSAARAWRRAERATEAIILNGTTATIFVRETAETSEFLCLVCAQGPRLESLVAHGHKTLSLISADL